MNRMQKKFVRLAIGMALVAIYFIASGQWKTGSIGKVNHDARTQTEAGTTLADSVTAAFRAKKNRVMVSGQGKVVRVLADDNQGIRHQRFILRLPSGLSLLIAHNIDKAPRISNLQKGDTVAFRGEYIWNEKGGLVHWTHQDSRGKHPGGWLRRGNRLYQ